MQTRRIFGSWVLAVGLAVVMAPRLGAADALRIATLAEPGSSWQEVFDRGGEQIAKATKGRVTVEYFPGDQRGQLLIRVAEALDQRLLERAQGLGVDAWPRDPTDASGDPAMPAHLLRATTDTRQSSPGPRHRYCRPVRYPDDLSGRRTRPSGIRTRLWLWSTDFEGLTAGTALG